MTVTRLSVLLWSAFEEGCVLHSSFGVCSGWHSSLSACRLGCCLVPRCFAGLGMLSRVLLLCRVGHAVLFLA
eukprot:scaffold114200_cov18-Tisochrysis_lutea.AAC.2